MYSPQQLERPFQIGSVRGGAKQTVALGTLFLGRE